MDLKISRGLFIIVLMFLVFIVAVPAITIFVPFENRVETFSEFALLGQNHDIIASPIKVSSQEMTELYVSLTSHMDTSEYYMVELKFRNNSLSSLENNISGSSSASILYSYHFVVDTGETIELPLEIGFSEIDVEGDVLVLNNFLIDDKLIPIRESTKVDMSTSNFYAELLFELWIYNDISDSFDFVGQKAWVWINIIPEVN